MKKVVYLAAAALLIVSCGKDSGDNAQEQIKSGEPVVTAEATEITMNSAILYGYVSTEYLLSGGESGFIVSTSSTPSLENGQKVVSSEVDKNGKYFVQVTGLASSSTYYYKAFLNTGTTNLVGEVKSFTTKDFAFAAIDLGLSVKWANANLGATAPEGYGDYYAWGETETKENYSWETYKWCNGSDHTLTKYNTDSYDGTVDNKTVLDPEDDVAHVKLGGSWRMPTDAEWTELRTQCKWTWTTQNGEYGYIVTATNGNSIFLPIAGCRYYTSLGGLTSFGGYYWSSSLDTGACAWFVFFSSGRRLSRFSDYRCGGQSVRPVSE